LISLKLAPLSTKFIKLLLAILFAVFVFEKSSDRSYINFDSIFYTASAHILEGNDAYASHSYSWELLKLKAEKSVFDNLCCSSSYRLSMFKNPEAFISHLPSYQTKSLYVFIVKIVANLFDSDEFEAQKIISLTSSCLLIMLSMFFLFQSNLYIYLMMIPIFLLMQIIPLTRLLTPDSLNALIFLSAGISFLNNKKILGYLLLLGSILIRQTNIIFYGAFLLFELRNKNYVKFLIMASFGLALYWLNSSYFESIGYWKTYYSSLISMPDTFIGFNPSFDISILFSTLLGKLNWMLGSSELNRLISLMILTFLVSLINLKNVKEIDLDDALVPVFFSAGAVITYILIPFPDFRIYAGYLLASIFTLMFGIAKRNKAD